MRVVHYIVILGVATVADGPARDSGLLLPLTTPLLAGPGTITTVIAISAAADGWQPTIVSLIAVGVAAIVVFASMAWLGGLIAKIRTALARLARRVDHGYDQVERDDHVTGRGRNDHVISTYDTHTSDDVIGPAVDLDRDFGLFDLEFE